MPPTPPLSAATLSTASGGRAKAALAALLTLTSASASAQPLAGDAVRGERVFQLCAACHDLKAQAGATPQAPPLAGIVGKPIARVDRFDYSDDLKALARRERVWSAALLDRYIAAPFRLAPKTSMSFPGLPDAQERADLVAFLETVK